MTTPEPNAKAPTPETDALFTGCFGCEVNDYTPNQKKALEHARRLERERDEAKAELKPSKQIPLNEFTRDILGRLCFQCRSLAVLLRASGTECKTRAEDEQAVAIHFMLNLYIEHGENWMEEGNKKIAEMGAALVAKDSEVSTQ